MQRVGLSRRALFFYGLALSLACDQLTKLAVRSALNIGESSSAGILRLAYVQNEGGAFGSFQGMSVLLLGGGLVAILLLLTAGLKANSRPSQLGWGLMVGGGMGNALDRLLFGRVTDFIDLRVDGFGWPVFNLADVFIVGGILILIFSYLRGVYGQTDHI